MDTNIEVMDETKPSVSDKRSRVVAVLLGWFVVVSILLLSLIFYLYIVYVKGKDSICLTRDCTLTASTLISAMDPTIDPCEDFSKFTCAEFIRKNPVPENKIQTSVGEMHKEYIDLQVKYVIESHNPHGDPDVVLRMQEAYHLCLNTSEDKEKEIDAFKDFVMTFLDGWPMAMGSEWTSKYETINDYIVNLTASDFTTKLIVINAYLYNVTTKHFVQRVNVEFRPFQTIWYYDDDDDESLDEETETEGTEEEKQEREKQRIKRKRKTDAKRNLLMKLLKLFGNPNEYEVAVDIDQIVKFSSFVKKLFNESDSDFIEMTIHEMNEQSMNKIDWLELIRSKFRDTKSFTLNSIILVKNANILHYLPEIFGKFSRKIFVNRIIGDLISPKFLLDYGNPNLVKMYYDYQTEMGKTSIPLMRWEFCLHSIRMNYPLVLTRLFVNKFVDKNGKKIVDEMAQMIQNAYKERIARAEWLDEPTKARAMRKAESIKRYVGYPDSIFDDQILEKHYKNLPTVRSTWFWHSLDMRRNITFKPLDMEELDMWQFDPFTIDAFYGHLQIWFPSGILQLPFFDENRLAAVNFGMIGSVIGHEIGHAFDDSDLVYNETYDIQWRNSASREMYETRKECFINQYNNYCPEELQGRTNEEKICVDGEYTLGENLADNTGLNAAYDAYLMWIDKYGEEQKLPGLEMYSSEQIFFISFGYSWCENISPGNWLKTYYMEEHAPSNYRVIGSLSNNQKFRNAFSCPKGPMNREQDSCVLW